MTESALTSPDLVLVFAQATTGLGHLRVTEALYEALPKNANSFFLTSQTVSDTVLYRIVSTNPILTSFMEYAQSGWREDAFLPLANGFFRTGLTTLEKQLVHILHQHYKKPKTLLVVATHHRPAYQINVLRKHFEKKYGIRIFIMVVVTDDSPQKVWAVPGADIIFVPSQYTKNALEAYAAHKKNLKTNKFFVSPYIVSPKLTIQFSTQKKENRLLQYVSDPPHSPVFSIPISGAAVQLPYLKEIITGIHKTWEYARFHVVTVESPFTRAFITGLSHVPTLFPQASASQRETIMLYEHLFTEHVIGFEITKPSEQAFKAMIPPADNGGAILLFSDPVGRQEYDNLAFLRRHGLIPSVADQVELWKTGSYAEHHMTRLRNEAAHWRGIRLPGHPGHATACIIRWMNEGIFEAMGNFSRYPDSPELSKDGAKLFWHHVSDFLRSSEFTYPDSHNA